MSYCRVESNAMGAVFARQLDKLVDGRILQVANTTNKQTRIIMQSAFVLNSFNFIKLDTLDARLFLENVLTYSKEGKNKHDDAADCLSGLSIFAQSMFKNRDFEKWVSNFEKFDKVMK